MFLAKTWSEKTFKTKLSSRGRRAKRGGRSDLKPWLKTRISPPPDSTLYFKIRNPKSARPPRTAGWTRSRPDPRIGTDNHQFAFRRIPPVSHPFSSNDQKVEGFDQKLITTPLSNRVYCSHFISIILSTKYINTHLLWRIL